MESVRKRRKPVGAKTMTKRSVPIADRRSRLWFPKDPKFHRVIVNDEFLEDYLKSGFTHVEYQTLEEGDRRYIGQGNIEDGSKDGAFVSWNVGRARSENTRGWLVQIPTGEWKEIQRMIREDRMQPMQELKQSFKEMKDSGYYGDAEVT